MVILHFLFYNKFEINIFIGIMIPIDVNLLDAKEPKFNLSSMEQDSPKSNNVEKTLYLKK